jgi:organic radical activating enzyme
MRDKPYCKAPWIGLTYESTVGCKPCCEWRGDENSSFPGTYTDYVKSDYLKNFKAMMYEDDMNKGCQQCIDFEERNLEDHPSRRQKYESYTINEHGDNKIVRFDYRAGNKCNLMCRMCHPEASSLREEEAIKHGVIDSIFRVESTDDAYDIDLSGCEKLMILGGEPSIDLGVRKWINHIKDIDMVVNVTTNATNTSKKWFDTLRQLKKLEINLSIDGTGQAQDFQRKGSVWEEVKSNIIKYRDEFRDVTIQLTASSINFTMLDTWWEELMELDIPIHSNPVLFPKEYSLRSIPEKYKEEQVTWLENWIEKVDTGDTLTATELHKITDWNEWKRNKVSRQIIEAQVAISILNNNPYNEDYNKKFKHQVKVMDEWRNENISDLDYRFKEILHA